MKKQNEVRFNEASEKAKSLVKEAETIVFENDKNASLELLTNPENLKKVKKINREMKKQISIIMRIQVIQVIFPGVIFFFYRFFRLRG